MRCDFWNWGKSNSEGEEPNASFEEVISLRNLTALEVCISDAECLPKTIEYDPNWVKFHITIGESDFFCCVLTPVNWSRQVWIQATTISLPEWFFNLATFKADALEWKGNLRLIDVFVGYKHGRFQGLKHLHVYNCHEVPIRRVADELPKDPVLENLEELRLWGLHSIEELHLGELPPGSLLNLKSLEVHYCTNWGNVLFPAKLLKRLPNLESIRGSYTSAEVEYVFGCEDFQPGQSKLREISLDILCEVRSICSDPAPRAMFQNLESLSIRGCDQLKGSLFTSDIAQCLQHLEMLILIRCPFIQRIFEPSNEKNILHKLKSLTLEDLPELCYESATIDFECPSLKYLNVKKCPQCLVSVSDFRTNSCFRELDES